MTGYKNCTDSRLTSRLSRRCELPHSSSQLHRSRLVVSASTASHVERAHCRRLLSPVRRRERGEGARRPRRVRLPRARRNVLLRFFGSGGSAPLSAHSRPQNRKGATPAASALDSASDSASESDCRCSAAQCVRETRTPILHAPPRAPRFRPPRFSATQPLRECL